MTSDFPALGPKNVGEALLMLRTRAGLSRDEAAEKIGMPAGTYSRYESNSNKRPVLDTLRKIAVVLSEAAGLDPAQVWEEIGQLLDDIDRARYVEAQAEVLDGSRTRP